MRERGAAFVERMWRDEAGTAGRAVSTLLAPAELAFRGLSRLRDVAYMRGLPDVVHAPVPVISVGNIAIGGTGKTPFSAFLARSLQALGHRPALLHGGYADDEPVLHRQWNPDVAVYVGRDRGASARAAAAAGATVLILDDGFQHRRLARDVDFVLVSAETWTRAPRLLPRGPWREPPSALRRATAVIVTYRTAIDVAPIAADVRRIVPGLPVWSARMTPERWRRAGAPDASGARADSTGMQAGATDEQSVRPGQSRPGTAAGAPSAPALLVAAIARPDLFAHGARAAGAQVADSILFRDHHVYTAADAAMIRERAAGRPIVTTAKDWVKLEPLLATDGVWLLEQDVVMTDGAAALDDMLAQVQVRNA